MQNEIFIAFKNILLITPSHMRKHYHILVIHFLYEEDYPNRAANIKQDEYNFSKVGTYFKLT